MRTALKSRARHPPIVDADVEAHAPITHPDAALAARAEARAVRAVLATLPAEQSVVVALFADGSLSHGEISAILGIPEGTVWSRLHKARKALAAAIA
jgi:RNA polymerase sigma-70 factor (ECF subfamily)